MTIGLLKNDLDVNDIGDLAVLLKLAVIMQKSLSNQNDVLLIKGTRSLAKQCVRNPSTGRE